MGAFYRQFRDDLSQDPRSTFATVAPYISMQLLYHVPVEVPVVRPLSLYTLPAMYSATRVRDVLVSKRPTAFFDLKAIFQSFADGNGRQLEFIDAQELYL